MRYILSEHHVLIIFAELKRKNKIKTKTNERNKRKIGYNFDRK